MNVYFTRTDDLHSALTEEWLQSAGQEKRSRVGRLSKENDRVLAAAAHRLLCYALNDEHGFVPHSDDWGTGLYGKPYLKDRQVHFNVSHSGDIVMCALHDRPVGVDIEKLRSIDENVARRIMSSEEYNVFQQAADKQRFFYQVWALKEAYLKYSGTGLTDALKELTIYPKDDHIYSKVQGCMFTSLKNIPGYQAAICTKECAPSMVKWIEADSLNFF